MPLTATIRIPPDARMLTASSEVGLPSSDARIDWLTAKMPNIDHLASRILSMHRIPLRDKKRGPSSWFLQPSDSSRFKMTGIGPIARTSRPSSQVFGFSGRLSYNLAGSVPGFYCSKGRYLWKQIFNWRTILCWPEWPSCGTTSTGSSWASRTPSPRCWSG